MPQTNPWTGRHASVSHFAPLFRYDHLPAHLQPVSKTFADAANQILTLCPTDGPELTVTLRKLWEAKNSAVVHNGFCQDQ